MWNSLGGGTRRGGPDRIRGQAQKPLLWLDMHLHCIVEEGSLVAREAVYMRVLTE